MRFVEAVGGLVLLVAMFAVVIGVGFAVVSRVADRSDRDKEDAVRRLSDEAQAYHQEERMTAARAAVRPGPDGFGPGWEDPLTETDFQVPVPSSKAKDITAPHGIPAVG